MAYPSNCRFLVGPTMHPLYMLRGHQQRWNSSGALDFVVIGLLWFHTTKSADFGQQKSKVPEEFHLWPSITHLYGLLLDKTTGHILRPQCKDNILQIFTILGCLSSYVPECSDNSDVFLCPAEACKNDTRFFPCQDGKYCIYENLLCDGYAQCQDGSGLIQDIFWQALDCKLTIPFHVKMKSPSYVVDVHIKIILV